MNFLAHIYLSGDNDLIKIGNFMADGIRGRQYEKYPLEIQKGIILHRAIDTFTDAHPIFRQSTKRLHQNYHHSHSTYTHLLLAYIIFLSFCQTCHTSYDKSLTSIFYFFLYFHLIYFLNNMYLFVNDNLDITS